MKIESLDFGIMPAAAMKSQPSSTELTLYHSARDIWYALLADMMQAQSDICVEQYIFADDEAARPFFDLFIQKAREGVSVRLIFDSIGSHTLRGSDTLLAMVEAGVRLHFYNEIGIDKIFSPRRWFPRNHCKTVIIDRKLVYIGSACVAEAMQDWRELQIRFEDEEAVADVQDDFDALWKSMEAGKYIAPTRGLLSFEANGNKLRYVPFRLPRPKANPLYRELLWQIQHAQNHIRLVTPYFTPPYRLRRALKRAVRRGVAVTFLMSEKTDVKIADWVARFYYPRLMRAGIRILLMEEAILHAKYMIVDDQWASIGSANLDYLSLFRNREANLVISELPVIDEMIAVFDRDAQKAAEAAPSDYPLREIFVMAVDLIRSSIKRVFMRGR